MQHTPVRLDQILALSERKKFQFSKSYSKNPLMSTDKFTSQPGFLNINAMERFLQNGNLILPHMGRLCKAVRAVLAKVFHKDVHNDLFMCLQTQVWLLIITFDS